MEHLTNFELVLVGASIATFCFGFNAQERAVGEVWIDTIDGARVITVAGDGCKDCAFATHAGGACPGAIYDRHPCCSSDRSDGREVYFKLITYVPEAKAPPLRMATFGSVPFKWS